MEDKLTQILERLNAIETMVAHLDKANRPSRFITRKEIVAEHGRTFYENALLWLNPVRKKGRNGRVKFVRKEYETFLKSHSDERS